jgi:hypothetical protein
MVGYIADATCFLQEQPRGYSFNKTMVFGLMNNSLSVNIANASAGVAQQFGAADVEKIQDGTIMKKKLNELSQCSEQVQ